ncbi:hypothetical protein [Pedobacter deserti]|uniref:hypothetical protein n=1 Tax=Pedobacter deserti TaxID=2817382 RepID=UPI002108F49A|nr:hypothetical protein [Pedobacter sp. SYSU D00382]
MILKLSARTHKCRTVISIIERYQPDASYQRFQLITLTQIDEFLAAKLLPEIQSTN